MRRPPAYVPYFCLLALLLLSPRTGYAQTLYWIGGPGDWTDGSHWSKNSGGTPAGIVPDEETNAIVDDNSGFGRGGDLTIPPGAHAVNSLSANRGTFVLAFSGTSGNAATLSVFGNLTLGSTLALTYATTSAFDNKWIFDGPATHRIVTAGNDLQSVEFRDENGKFDQFDDLTASRRIRMFAGTWNSAGHDVRTEYLYFADGNPSSNALTKTFNTDGSNIYADEWDSRFAYQSLVVVGAHQIHVGIFDGSPGSPTQTFSFDEIHLLELPDDNPPGVSLIEYNNLDCANCDINRLIIEDTGDTQLGGSFTINENLTVSNPGSSIFFNAGNGRGNEVTIDGTVTVPPAGGCGDRTTFAAIFSDFTVFTRATGTLTVTNATLRDIQTSGGATFTLSNGILRGSSSGWNVVSPPAAQEYVWVGPGAWDELANWTLANGDRAGCLPGVLDNVTVDATARGDLRIPAGYVAQCNDLTWSNEAGLTLLLDGLTNTASLLEIGGDLVLHRSATVTGAGSHRLRFVGTSANRLVPDGVSLPDLEFAAPNASWELESSLTAGNILVYGGTLSTRGNNVTAASWRSFGSEPITYLFGSSLIQVAGLCEISSLADEAVTVNPGSSVIRCAELLTREDLHEVILTGQLAQTFAPAPVAFATLTLAGSGAVNLREGLTVGELVFAADGAALRIGKGNFSGQPYDLVVTGGITSQASIANPATLRSRIGGNQAQVAHPTGNLCVTGRLAFQDIAAVLPGVFHAPKGTDLGNNTGITFTDAAAGGDLHWIGDSGDWIVNANWSLISGGCPASTNPDKAARLIFDANSFFSAAPTVTLPASAACGQLRFTGFPASITLNIPGALTASQLTVTDATVTLSGATLEVQTTTEVGDDGTLTSEVADFLTDQLATTAAGILYVQPGSSVRVQR